MQKSIISNENYWIIVSVNDAISKCFQNGHRVATVYSKLMLDLWSLYHEYYTWYFHLFQWNSWNALLWLNEDWRMFSTKPFSPLSNPQKPERSANADFFRPTRKANLSSFYFSPINSSRNLTFVSFFSDLCIFFFLFSFFLSKVFYLLSRLNFLPTYSLGFFCLMTGSLFRTNKNHVASLLLNQAKLNNE